MTAAALKADALLPQPTGGLAPGAAVSLAVHVGLIVALTVGIDWRSHPPEVISAELWAAVPQTAAPPPPLPAPAPPPPPPVARTETPPEADIALERERRQKAEQKKAEEKKAEEKKAEEKKAADDKKAEADRKKKEQAEAAREAEEKAEEERLNRQRQENLRRMLAQAGSAPTGTSSTGTAAQTAAPSANYLGKVRAAVRANLVFTGTVPGNAAAEVTVNTAPGGSVISRRLAKSSGNKAWDEAVLQAIDKTVAFPRDTDGRVPPSFTLVFRQND